MRLKVFIDGGARGNPGIAGYGVYIEDENKKILLEEGKFLGIKTNNEADYMGLIGALTWINDKVPNEEIEVNSDSQLLVRQMKGIYKVKAPHLRLLWNTAKNLCDGKKIEFKEIRREYNVIADTLANQAMDGKK